MNWSIYTADRTTHLKIVVVGLLAALLISFIGIAASVLNRGTDLMTAQASHRDQCQSARDLYRPQRSGRPLARRRKRKTLLLSQPPALIKSRCVLSPLYVRSPKADIRQRDCHVRFVPKADKRG